MTRCNHPELRPTQWNQPKPEPAEMIGCCEDNQICPVCGWGHGAFPCRCMREYMRETVSPKRYVWMPGALRSIDE